LLNFPITGFQRFVSYKLLLTPRGGKLIEITDFSALSFLLLSGPADQALEWTLISASDRATIKSQYAAAGIKIVVSAFGSTDAPTSSGADPVATANTMAAWVKEFGLDGIDVDYEVGFFLCQ
jgi:chitinase